MDFSATLTELGISGNLRRLPDNLPDNVTDFTSNDYLGLAGNAGLREKFLEKHKPDSLVFTSSASRLLAGNQKEYVALEKALADSYGKEALLFNSGYHANTGIIQAIAGKSDLILADRLVHASIIDGIRLSGARFIRFAHNNLDALEKLLTDNYKDYSSGNKSIIVIVESIYSMDGDRADLRRLVELKRKFPETILYVDEAHAVGAVGPAGLGEAVAQGVAGEIDILIGTFGKALASAGAFAITDGTIRNFLINRARSLIFSTALPPVQALWTEFMWKTSLDADSLRRQLAENSRLLAEVIPGGEPSHIRPLIVGDSRRAVTLSGRLFENDFNVLPIRTPTVPPGTERLRFSLSAATPPDEILRLGRVIKAITS